MSVTGGDEMWTSEWHKLSNGVYWWRLEDSETPVVVRVFKSMVFSFGEEQGRRLNTYGGEFLGPVTVADTERLVRLGKVLDRMVAAVRMEVETYEYAMKSRQHAQEAHRSGMAPRAQAEMKAALKEYAALEVE